MNKIDISVIIPAYNEEKNIRLGALDKVYRYLTKLDIQWEVVLVNDGSTDLTRKLLETYCRENKRFRLLDNPHQGKARTVISGIFASRGQVILFTDLDQATPIEELAKLLPWFDRGYDIVIGSRSNRRQGAPYLRLIMARGFILFRSMVLGLKGIKDTQCGFKAFRRNVARNIFSSLRLYGQQQIVLGSKVTAGFDIELLFLAQKRGYQIKEVPVEWHYVETRRVNPLKDSWEGIWDVLRIKINAMNGLYNLQLK